MHNAIYITDPSTGESVTLSELAKRHGIHVSTLSRRYSEGLRGKTLLKKPNLNAHLAEQNAKAKEAVERRQAIMSASTIGLTRPFNHIADAGKMIGGAQ